MPDSRQVISGLISSYFGILRGQDTYFQINMFWRSRRAIAKGAALVAIGIVIARSHTEWPIDESWIGLGTAATWAAVVLDPLTWRRVEIRPTVRVTRTTRAADPDRRLTSTTSPNYGSPGR